MRRGLALLAFLAASPALAQPMQPAELPPADFAGQQYVDSRGCAFVRAGTEAQVLWVPRVSREGQAVCGYPPSGRHVPVVGEAEVQSVSQPPAPAAPDASAAEQSTGAFYVAVGSFALAANADHAVAALEKMDYGVIRGQVKGGSGTLITVFAGPYPDATSAEAAREVLRGKGFPDAMLIRP